MEHEFLATILSSLQDYIVSYALSFYHTVVPDGTGFYDNLSAARNSLKMRHF
jgi:hypothetical protein